MNFPHLFAGAYWVNSNVSFVLQNIRLYLERFDFYEFWVIKKL